MKKDLQTILNHTKENNGCLEWQKCLNTDGYPRAFIDGNANAKVHRVVWELYNLKSALGYVIRHKCDNPLCLNPAHLLLGTPQQNVKDMDERGRRQGLSQKDCEAIHYLKTTLKYKAKEIAALYRVSKSTIYYSLNNRKAGN